MHKVKNKKYHTVETVGALTRVYDNPLSWLDTSIKCGVVKLAL